MQIIIKLISRGVKRAIRESFLKTGFSTGFWSYKKQQFLHQTKISKFFNFLTFLYKNIVSSFKKIVPLLSFFFGLMPGNSGFA